MNAQDSQAITLTVIFNEPQARAYARFLEQVPFRAYQLSAENAQEAYSMNDASELIREALRRKGFAPR